MLCGAAASSGGPARKQECFKTPRAGQCFPRPPSALQDVFIWTVFSRLLPTPRRPGRGFSSNTTKVLAPHFFFNFQSRYLNLEICSHWYFSDTRAPFAAIFFFVIIVDHLWGCNKLLSPLAFRLSASPENQKTSSAFFTRCFFKYSIKWAVICASASE